LNPVGERNIVEVQVGFEPAPECSRAYRELNDTRLDCYRPDPPNTLFTSSKLYVAEQYLSTVQKDLLSAKEAEAIGTSSKE